MEVLLSRLSAQEGVLGVVATLAIVIAVILARELKKCWSERLGDTFRVQELVATNHVVIAKNNDLSEARTRAQEAMTRVLEQNVREQVATADELKRLQATNVTLREEIARMLREGPFQRSRGG